MNMMPDVNWNKLLEAAKDRGIRPAEIERDVGFERTSLKKWTKSGVDPSYSRASIVWNYLVTRIPRKTILKCCDDSGD